MSPKPKKRELIKGPLRPPPSKTTLPSYTQTPASRDEVVVRGFHRTDNPVVTKFSSRAVPQPLLDPTIIQRRIQAEKQWKYEQEKIQRAAKQE